MVTFTFITTKASKGLVIVPTVVVDYSDKAKNATIDLLFCWLRGTLSVTINWASK